MKLLVLCSTLFDINLQSFFGRFLFLIIIEVCYCSFLVMLVILGYIIHILRIYQSQSKINCSGIKLTLS